MKFENIAKHVKENSLWTMNHIMVWATSRKQVKPRFITNSRAIASINKKSENSEKFQKVSKLSEYVKIFDTYLK